MRLSSLLLLGGWLPLLLAACQPEPPSLEAPPSTPEPEGLRLFIGTGSGDPAEGIYAYRMNPETGALTLESKTDSVLNPTFLALSPDGSVLYSVNEVYDQPAGAVSAFRVDPDSARLTPINRQSSNGQGPCYIAVDATGRWVMTANYGSGSVALYPVRPDGGLEPASDVAQHTGSGAHPQRQTGPHAHAIHMDPQNRHALAADLGTDDVRIYPIDLEQGSLRAQDAVDLQLPPGSGPRHFTFHPNGEWLYVLNELNGTVAAFTYDAGQGTASPLQTLSSLPEGFEGTNSSADIHVHPSGRFLYASNRSESASSIAIFTIGNDGRLTLAGHQTDHINWPRNFALDPAGRFLLVANRRADNVRVFRIDESTGLLTDTGHAVRISQPVCIKFAPQA